MTIRKAFCIGLLLCQLLQGSGCQKDNPSKRNIMNVVELKAVEENASEAEIFDLAEYYRRPTQGGRPPGPPRSEAKLTAANPDLLSSFRFERESQKLIANPRLDRETLCQSSSEKCFVQLELNVVGRETLKLNIEIVDINDHPPAFAEGSYQLHVSELSQPEVIFHLKPAVDLDYGRNAEVTFSLQPPDSHFRLEVERNSLGKIVDLRLCLAGQLDRETESSYRLVVLASDSGTPTRLSGSTVIEVVVDDENDNQPIFERARYAADLQPDDPIGHTVLTVRASDRDEGQNARIKYYFPKKTSAVYGRLFTVDSATGDIKLAADPADHRHLNAPFKLVVFAEDHGPNAIPTSTSVVIRVVNTNNNAPAISLESRFAGSDPHNLIVDENNAHDFVLAKVLARDADPGEAGLVDCKTKDASLFYLTRMDSNAFQLVVKDPLDREKEGLHVIDVECEDMGTPPLSSRLRVSLIVTDVDDNPPRFSRREYAASIGENNRPGAVVGQLEVEDLDAEPPNARNDFFVEPHFQHLFRVDQSARLVALVSLDREQSDGYSFHVFAKGGKLPGDNSSYRHVAKALVNVTVLDADDERPRFEQPWYKFAVMENKPAGTIVGKVKAVDLDLPPNNIVRYSLDPSAAPSVLDVYDANSGRRIDVRTPELPFSVEPLSGLIFSKVPLDRELQGRYEFSVFVHNDSASVFVDVLDANDNPPLWLHPKSDSSSSSSCQGTESQLRIKGNLTFGQHLDRLLAQDIDAGVNSQVAYKILSGNEMNQFSLESNSGTLSWNSYLSGPMFHPQQPQPQQQQVNPCQVRLLLAAEDGGEPRMTSQTACFEVVFEECLLHSSAAATSLPSKEKSEEESGQKGGQARGNFSELYVIVIAAVLVVGMVVAVTLTAFICITRQQTRDLKKREEFRRADLRASLPLTGPDNEAVLVLDRSSTNESSDQLTGILVSLRSAEQLGRLQLRSLAPSKDSLMSTSISLHRERDADSGYADVSPV